MSDDLLLIILPAGLFWLSALVWILRGVGRLRASAAWIGAWLSIWLAGVIVASSPGEAGSAASSVLGTLFAGLLLAGSYRFGDRPLPRGLPFALAALTLGVGAAELWLYEWAGVVSSAVDASLVGLAAVQLIRHHTLDRSAGSAERALGPLFLVIMALEALDWRHHGGAAPNETLGVWAGVGVATGFLMVVVVGERARRREREQAAALQAETTMLHGMTDAVPVGILLSDCDGYVARTNERMCEHLGLEGTPERWTGRKASEMMALVLEKMMDSERQMVTMNAPAFARDRRISFSAVPFRFKDGRTIVLSAHSVDGSDGRHLGRVWVSRDVTDERRIAERIQHAERMETVGTLAGGLAHDFNNQLTAILGSAALMRESGSLGEEDLELIGDLEGAAQHCADLTRGLLAFSRREPADPHNVELGVVIDRVDSLLRPSLPPDVELRTYVAEDAGRVYADEIQLQRVLTNLIVNARDAVGERGKIELLARAGDGVVEIKVSDDGHGMDETTRRRIFDPFFTTKPVGEGTGLGLAIVYGIVEAHGGRVEVETRAGGGCTFTVLWPGPELDARAALAVSRAKASLPMGTRILLAEDEPAVRRLVAWGLQGVGMEVTTVVDGEAAVAEFGKRPDDFDVVLFDYSMPGRNGVDAIRAIRELRPDFPALVMSGHPTRPGREGWPADVPLLLKPFAPERLVARLAQVMGEPA